MSLAGPGTPGPGDGRGAIDTVGVARGVATAGAFVGPAGRDVEAAGTVRGWFVAALAAGFAVQPETSSARAISADGRRGDIRLLEGQPRVATPRD
jgi:hypothetical protein